VARARLTRRVGFTATHRYDEPRWGDFHEHAYTCDVTVGGEIDRATGFVIDLEALDEVIQAVVIARFDHRNINLDVPEFEDGRLVPSTENLARFIFERVEEALGRRGIVEEVRVAEDDTLWATYDGGA
jgi:6-pyruvoyltetrahydropterin/6-carboxytetrahydropterin synthase